MTDRSVATFARQDKGKILPDDLNLVVESAPFKHEPQVNKF